MTYGGLEGPLGHKRIMGGRRVIARETRQKIADLFLNTKLSMREIAKQCDVTYQTVFKYTRRLVRRLEREEKESIETALRQVKHSTRENIILSSKLVGKHLETVIADENKLKSLTPDQVMTYADLSAREHAKLRAIEGLPLVADSEKLDENGAARVTSVGQQLLARLTAVDIIGHAPAQPPKELPAPAAVEVDVSPVK